MRPIASWETPWMFLASFVIVLWILTLNVCGDTLGIPPNPELPSELPCPDPEVIAPCECTFNATLGMDMDCSNVTSEDELRRVFSNDFARTDFRKFTIINNYNITSLREGDLGSVSFKDIYIQFTSLSEIEDDALMGSFNTLVSLYIYGSSLTSVPDISTFTHLEYLQALFNEISRFPNGSSATLLYLQLEGNHIDDVPCEALTAMPSLKVLSLVGNELTEIYSHTFTRNENLTMLFLGGNKLTTIPDDAITLHGQSSFLHLSDNQITSITYETVSSVTGHLWISNNSLTEMPEKVFRPLLEDSVEVRILDNPLKCGCDIAWLILNQNLISNGLGFAKCSDGENISDLDPEVYKVMCPNATAVPL